MIVPCHADTTTRNTNDGSCYLDPQQKHQLMNTSYNVYQSAFIINIHIHGYIAIEARTIAKPNQFGNGEAKRKNRLGSFHSD